MHLTSHQNRCNSELSFFLTDFTIVKLESDGLGVTIRMVSISREPRLDQVQQITSTPSFHAFQLRHSLITCQVWASDFFEVLNSLSPNIFQTQRLPTTTVLTHKPPPRSFQAPNTFSQPRSFQRCFSQPITSFSSYYASSPQSTRYPSKASPRPPPSAPAPFPPTTLTPPSEASPSTTPPTSATGPAQVAKYHGLITGILPCLLLSRKIWSMCRCCGGRGVIM